MQKKLINNDIPGRMRLGAWKAHAKKDQTLHQNTPAESGLKIGHEVVLVFRRYYSTGSQ